MQTIITDKWNKYLDSFDDADKDIYYYEDYVKLYESDMGRAFCAVCVDGKNILLMPFIRKRIGEYFDFETAYGYGGPIANTKDQIWVDLALGKMGDMFRLENYICGFIRFHSLLNNARICSNYIQVLHDRDTIAIDTGENEEQIWLKQISSKNRNMIRKAEHNGLAYKAEYDFASMSEFKDIYTSTMIRLNAEEFYFFDANYYKRFVENFKGRAFLGTVRKDKELICGAVFMYSNNYGHYHLAGSNKTYAGIGANNYMIWKTALEFNQLGVKVFHLGGGYDSSPDNSLLRFKKSFSSNIKEFCIGKWIFNQDRYDEIKAKWLDSNPEKNEKYGHFLMCYRY